ncbi:MAG: hypothetical protein LBU42_03525 [Prevotellaceae bacterium]|jgi:hypothetical protein|nr:hypothetical protein [Prevotellaceae bacterium]
MEEDCEKQVANIQKEFQAEVLNQKGVNAILKKEIENLKISRRQKPYLQIFKKHLKQ